MVNVSAVLRRTAFTVCARQFKVCLLSCYSLRKTHTLNTINKMGSWRDEKERYLNMDINEKRREYICGNKFVKVSDVKTWADYVAQERRMTNKTPMLPDNSIDLTKNVALASKISLFQGDITKLEVDAIVNAANSSLLGGGGVDGAIHNAAGDELLKENKTLGGCHVGEAKITGGYRLPAKYVIATVGPRGERTEDLKNCYRNSLEVMREKGLRTIAFPCISTGIYGYPLVPAAHVAAMEVRTFLESNGDNVDRVIFCLYADTDVDVYQGILQTYFPILID